MTDIPIEEIKSEETEPTPSALVPVESQPEKSGGVMNSLMDFAVKAINDADEEAARARVAALRKKKPLASDEIIVGLLIKQKCTQAGAVGAVTSGTSLIPGLGTMASLTFGVAADIGMTFKLQAELVLEIAAVYGHTLTDTEKRNAILFVTGVSAGTNQVLTRVGKEVAQKATERLAQRSIVKAIPVLGVAASAGTNVASTYIIGQRAQAYFSLGEEAVDEWGESVRAITGVDERRMVRWLSDTTENSWTVVKNTTQDAAQVVIVAGLTAGEAVAMGISKAGVAVIDVGKTMAQGVAGFGQRTGERAKQGVSKVGTAIATGAGKAKEAVSNAGKSVAEGASTARSKVFRRRKSKEEALPLDETTSD